MSWTSILHTSQGLGSSFSKQKSNSFPQPFVLVTGLHCTLDGMWGGKTHSGDRWERGLSWVGIAPDQLSKENISRKLSNITESVATLPPFGPIEGQKWFDQISNQWESQKNRFALIYFGKNQFFPPCIWNIPFMSYRLRPAGGRLTSSLLGCESKNLIVWKPFFFFELYFTVAHSEYLFSAPQAL